MRWFLFLAFMGAVAYMLVWSPYVRVEHAVVTGVPADMGARIEAVTESELSGWGWGRISRASFFAVHERTLEQRVIANFPEVRSIRVTKRFPQSVTVEVEMRGTVLVMCSGGPCFVVDESGMLIGNEDALDPKSPRVRVIDTSAAPIDFSEPLVTQDFIGFALEVHRVLADRLKTDIVGDMTTPSRLSGALEVQTSEGWRLLLDSHVDLSETLDNLALFFSRQIKDDLDRRRLEYVDARTENRIYYRFLGDTTPDQKPPDSVVLPVPSAQTGSQKDKRH